VNSELDVAGVVDVGGDLKNDADVLVFEVLAQPDGTAVLAGCQDRDLLPDEEPAGFVVADIDLRLGQDSGVGGPMQELDEEVHVNGAAEDTRPERGQALGDGVGVWGVDDGIPAKTLHVASRRMGEDRVLIVIGREDLAAIRGPADAELVEEIAGDFDEPRFDQDLLGLRIEFLDQLQDLRKEVNVCGNEQRITALISDGTHAADQVAYTADGSAAVGAARVVGLAAEPGEVTVFFRRPLQLEGWLGGGALLLQLLGRLVALGLLLVDGAQRRRPVFGEQDVDAVGHGEGFGELKADAERAFTASEG